MADEPAPEKGEDKGKEPESKETTATTTDPEKGDEAKIVEQADKPDAVKRALDAERKAAGEAKKRAEAAEAKVREYEDANKSEMEKLQGKAQKAEQAKAEAESKLLRFEVAAEKQVPSKLVPLLTASTKEALEEQADLILDNAKAGEKSPDFDGGARESASKTQTAEDAHNETFLAALGLKPN